MSKPSVPESLRFTFFGPKSQDDSRNREDKTLQNTSSTPTIPDEVFAKATLHVAASGKPPSFEAWLAALTKSIEAEHADNKPTKKFEN